MAPLWRLAAALVVAGLGGCPALGAAAGPEYARPERGICAAAGGELEDRDGAACADAPGLGLLQRASMQRLAEKAPKPAAARAAKHVRKAEAANAEDAAKDGGWPRPLDYQYAPYAWLHVPKCGSSFINALVRLPGACHDVPDDIEVTDATFGIDNLKGFFDAYPGHCPGSFVTGGNHVGVGPEVPQYDSVWKGHGVTLLRQPEQRILSAFHDSRHSWPVKELGLPPLDPARFASVIQGCAVKMLTRGGVSYEVKWFRNLGIAGPHWGGPCGDPKPPVREEVDLAKRRLREDFPFVGIQEKWELSMCLFHATFGGPCHSAEFTNSRHAASGQANSYNVAVLRGFRDVHDGELYAEAEAIFDERMRRYNMSVEACQPCFREAGIIFTG